MEARDGEAQFMWVAEEFEEQHVGYAGAVLADGSEPRLVYLDLGSGASMQSTREWWAYTGRFGRPKAAGFRGACACGWRGPDYPIDWDRLGDEDDLDDADLSGPYRDWAAHIDAVEQQTVPLPADVTDLIDLLHTRLGMLADDHPAAALRAVAALERLARNAGRTAAYRIDPSADHWADELARHLGTTPDRARSRVQRHLLGP
ncbi:hypothetical protein ACWD0A_33325 [Streptomyces sp. NPDC002867]